MPVGAVAWLLLASGACVGTAAAEEFHVEAIASQGTYKQFTLDGADLTPTVYENKVLFNSIRYPPAPPHKFVIIVPCTHATTVKSVTLGTKDRITPVADSLSYTLPIEVVTFGIWLGDEQKHDGSGSCNVTLFEDRSYAKLIHCEVSFKTGWFSKSVLKLDFAGERSFPLPKPPQ